MGRAASRVLALVLVAAVGGCGPARTRPDSIASTSYAGLPSNAPTPSNPLPETVTGVLSASALSLTTMGSSSCPDVPVNLEVRDARTIEVTFSNDYGRGTACTTDFGATTSVLDLPEAVRGADSLTVHILGDGVPQVTLTLSRT
jgi:hypothetical protein